MATPTSPTLPTRSGTTGSDEVSGSGDDSSEATRLFEERLQAWKHACGYLEAYIESTSKMQTAHGKEYDKVLKTVNQPLREGNHFTQSMGGISEMFDHIRSNTQLIGNTHAETAKNLENVVLPIFKRLHAEIKNKSKELAKGVGKNIKGVDKARENTQKQIQLLGQHTATYSSTVSAPNPNNDPFVIQKGVYYRLNRQINEENNTRQDMLTVQDNFSQFEMHVVDVLQQGMDSFYQAVGGQADAVKKFYSDMAQQAAKIDPLFEWNGFVGRNDAILIDKTAPPRTLDSSTFPNQNHPATQPLVQGSLERVRGMMRRDKAAFFAVTPAKFLHGFPSDDNLAKDPSPDLSLYLPDCAVGGCNGNTFTLKGKDISSAISKAKGTQEYSFKAQTDKDADKWWSVVRQVASSQSGVVGEAVAGAGSPPVSPSNSVKAPVSPVVAQQQTMSPAALNTTPAQDVSAASPTSPTSEGAVPPPPAKVVAPETATAAEKESELSAGTGKQYV